MSAKSSKLELAGLSRFEHLTLAGGVELSKALTWVADKIERFVSFDHIYDFETGRLKHWIDFYSQQKFIERPEKFFTIRRRVPKVKETTLHKLDDGEVLEISYNSNYMVKCKEYEEEFLSYKNNRKVRARYWRHTEKPKATMIALHGWTMDDQRLNALAFLPGYFYRMGLDVILIELPFHGQRVCKDSAGRRISFPAPHIARTNEGLGQAISDLRRLRNYLDSVGRGTVGCIGMSLGGYIASLWASLDPLEFCIPIVPVADMAGLAWDMGAERSEFQALKDAGLTESDLRKVFSIHSPLTHPLKLEIHRTMIIAGLADHIVPPKHPKMLWEHWGEPEAHWLSGGHLVHLRETKAIKKIGDFLVRLGFGDRLIEET